MWQHLTVALQEGDGSLQSHLELLVLLYHKQKGGLSLGQMSVGDGEDGEDTGEGLARLEKLAEVLMKVLVRCAGKKHNQDSEVKECCLKLLSQILEVRGQILK